MFSDTQKTILKAAVEFEHNHGLTTPYLCGHCGGPGLTGDPETTLQAVLRLEVLGLLYRGNPSHTLGQGDYANRWFPTTKGRQLVTSGELF